MNIRSLDLRNTDMGEEGALALAGALRRGSCQLEARAGAGLTVFMRHF